MRSTLAILPILLLAACGGTGANIDAEGCAFLADGPFTAVTAGATMDATAPSIVEGLGAYTVTLPAAGTGYLQFDSPDDTEYAVFLTRDVTVKAFTPTGVEIPASANSTSSSVCDDIRGRHIIELPVGLFYFQLGPDTADPVDVVLLHYDPD